MNVSAWDKGGTGLMASTTTTTTNRWTRGVNNAAGIFIFSLYGFFMRAGLAMEDGTARGCTIGT
nr:hypothetical protein [Candidatus Sigynarchaeota archaeon]